MAGSYLRQQARRVCFDTSGLLLRRWGRSGGDRSIFGAVDPFSRRWIRFFRWWIRFQHSRSAFETVRSLWGRRVCF
ncbi:hypothetical protein PAXRUDRAFT_568219 [Paxillus rubicundulus Ve08.2h10]|uniref:Uncharacterized protein n=1 Tax=Paxillus rubicundulus Ve08.2h10 TaxID=930991 RepID=A0A0D0CSQ7_9AGAM|nr:hypothetical protein PAXRUDRAFT_568219 [Paxillus rubicundulus Ve08.2h10]